VAKLVRPDLSFTWGAVAFLAIFWVISTQPVPSLPTVIVLDAQEDSRRGQSSLIYWCDAEIRKTVFVGLGAPLEHFPSLLGKCLFSGKASPHLQLTNSLGHEGLQRGVSAFRGFAT
jgi:hypothetical protein